MQRNEFRFFNLLHIFRNICLGEPNKKVSKKRKLNTISVSFLIRKLHKLFYIYLLHIFYPFILDLLQYCYAILIKFV